MADTSRPRLLHLQNAQSIRVLWCLRYLDVDCDVEVLPRRRDRSYPELLSLHPLGHAPVLVLDGVAYAETRLCLERLRERYGAGRLDKVGRERDDDDYFAEMGTATLLLGVMLCFLLDMMASGSPWPLRPLLRTLLGPVVRMLARDLERPLGMMEAHLARGPTFFGGGSLGVSDFVMIWPMDMAVMRGYVALGEFPHLSAWYERIHALESYKRAVAETGKYDMELV